MEKKPLVDRVNARLLERMKQKRETFREFLGFNEVMEHYTAQPHVSYPVYAKDSVALQRKHTVQGTPVMTEAFSVPFTSDLQQAEKFWVKEPYDAESDCVLTQMEMEQEPAAQGTYTPYVMVFREKTLEKRLVELDNALWQEYLEKAYRGEETVLSVNREALLTMKWELIPLSEAQKQCNVWKWNCYDDGKELLLAELKQLVVTADDAEYLDGWDAKARFIEKLM